MKLNFKEFKMFVDIEQAATRTIDIRKEFADVIYKSVNGIVAHDLAMRIYKSEGEMEITQPDELRILQDIVNGATPIFADSYRANVSD